MSKKVITGAVIALAAGIAAYFYNRNRSKINEAAADAYNVADEAINGIKDDVEHSFSQSFSQLSKALPIGGVFDYYTVIKMQE